MLIIEGIKSKQSIVDDRNLHRTDIEELCGLLTGFLSDKYEAVMTMAAPKFRDDIRSNTNAGVGGIIPFSKKQWDLFFSLPAGLGWVDFSSPANIGGSLGNLFALLGREAIRSRFSALLSAFASDLGHALRPLGYKLIRPCTFRQEASDFVRSLVGVFR
jgi:hypothetical protein